MPRPTSVEYPLLASIDKRKLERLIQQFDPMVYREQDKSLTRKLRKELLESDTPRLRKATVRQLAAWCTTGGIYSEGMIVARKISQALFGVVIDGTLLGV